MINEVYVIVISIIVGVVLFTLGWLFGLEQRQVLDWLESIQKDINRWRQQEEEIEDESAIVETSPRSIREKVNKGETPDEDSAIVTVKSPREVRKEKELQLERDLDKLGR